MNVESEKRTYMKRIIFAILMLASAFTMTAGSGKVNTGAVLSLVRTYNAEPGFDVVSVGKLGIGLARLVANMSVETEEDRKALALLNDINKVVVVDYMEASESKRDAFNSELYNLLDKAEKIIEVKDEEDVLNIYGTSVNGGESIDDLVVFIPEDCTLICILGSISADRIADLIEMTND